MQSRPNSDQYIDVAIIGGGPAGLSAAIYTGRAQLNTVVLEKGLPGGQIAQTQEVENYPGFDETVSGPELSQRMVRQAEKFGARIVIDEAQSVEQDERGFRVVGYDRVYHARAGIRAAMAVEKWLAAQETIIEDVQEVVAVADWVAGKEAG